jgi:serine/threonine-protein kinase
VALTPGTRLGPHEVVAQIGTGGMGEVYRARDMQLNRDVALKVIPDAFTLDPDRLARFKREAQVLASLNHANIAAIYGFEESKGVQALVLELVEGPTLAERIAKGPLPLDEALPIAIQIAEALEAAHEQGIIHRDLKPANVKVRDDGTVKVLDFGLAKALEPAATSSPNVTQSPTITTPAIVTGIGVILGTAAYMSPEQAKGRPADKRCDVWAFGCVLFEILAGRRAFEGEGVSDTLAVVLRGEPDWAALPKDLPPSIDRIVRRSLEKDRRRRIGDVSTIRFLLDERSTMMAASPGADTRMHADTRPRAIVVAAVGLALVAAALGGLAVWTARPRPMAPVVSRFTVRLGEGQTYTNTGDLTIAISPDGTRIAYTASARLYVRSLSDLEAQPIRGTEVNPRRPMFSPDGASIAYFSPQERALKRIAVGGGAPVTIVTMPDTPNAPLGGSWAGQEIFFGQVGGPLHGIVRVSAGGGKLERVVEIQADEVADAPQILPDGEHLLFTLGRGVGSDRWQKSRVVVQSLRTGERKTLVDGGADGRYVRTGHLLYALGGVVFARHFDPNSREILGAPVPIIEGVRRGIGATQTAIAQMSVSDNGTLAYIPGPNASTDGQLTLTLLNQNGATEALKIPPGAYRDPRISPDGRQIAFGTDDGQEASLWVYDLLGTSAMRRLTFDGNSRFPVWSPDGSRIALQSDREGDLAVFAQRTDGTGKAERLTKPEPGTTHVPESWSPDGKWLLFSAVKESNFVSMLLSLDDNKTTPFDDVRSAQSINATFSPDGHWVAYSLRRSGVTQIYVQSFPPGAVYQISKATTSSVVHPFWSRDGRHLYYILGSGEFAVVGITTSPVFGFTDPRPLSRGPAGFVIGGPTNTRQTDSTPDGRVVAVVDSNTTRPTAGLTSASPLFVVVNNWFEELKARVPTK